MDSSLTALKDAKRAKAYDYLRTMMELKDKAMPHFSGPDGERSWNDLVDDSEMILNGYTLSRAEQGKADWQSNMMDNVSRVKMKAVAAGVALAVPGMSFTARNKKGNRSQARAEIFKNVVQQTFKDGNPTLAGFREMWHMLAHGVVFEYEGYKTGGAMRDRVVSFNSLTGEVETKKEYVKMNSKPFTVLLNPQEFFWWTFFTNDVQQQPRVAWLQNYTKSQLEEEFSKYPNFKEVKDKKGMKTLGELNSTTFFREFEERVQNEDEYEVFRLYDKENDRYQIWINCVEVLDVPILWGDKEKVYPFAVQQAEYYANTNFFVGMPFGQLMEAYQEHKNTVINTMIDKLYRSAKKPMLIGLQNKDLLDVEDQYIDEDNKYYVPDIDQVKPFPYEGPNQGEFVMLSILDKGLEMLSVDRTQQGMAAGGGRTARESVIADARAQEIKGSLYLALENLWFQKTRLRNQVVMSHYINDRAVGTEMKDKIISIPDYIFGDGARGILDIHIADKKSDLMSVTDLEAREAAMEEQGVPYKIISIEKTYLDEWEYDFQILPDSFHKKDKELEMAEFDSEVEWVATLHPEFFAANKEQYLEEKLSFRGKRLNEFTMPQPAPTPEEAAMAEAGGGATPAMATSTPGATPLEEGEEALPVK
jgi:hypothetical protein